MMSYACTYTCIRNMDFSYLHRLALVKWVVEEEEGKKEKVDRNNSLHQVHPVLHFLREGERRGEEGERGHPQTESPGGHSWQEARWLWSGEAFPSQLETGLRQRHRSEQQAPPSSLIRYLGCSHCHGRSLSQVHEMGSSLLPPPPPPPPRHDC